MKFQLFVLIITLILLNTGFFGCVEKTELSIEYFKLEPIIIQKGEIANLSWKVTGATSVIIDNNIGNVNLYDSIIISPEEDTTYTLHAIFSNEIINSSVTIFVEDKKQENKKETPIVNMSAVSYNMNSSVLIKIYKISKIGVEWSTVSGKIINENNGEIVSFINMDWRPNGMITERDEIIITNSMIKPNLIPGTYYTFILSYQITNKIMGDVSWIQ
ncbi:MAG: hypothetical protein V3S79_04305 [Candidatus Thermoplasmatota archaeon]